MIEILSKSRSGHDIFTFTKYDIFQKFQTKPMRKSIDVFSITKAIIKIEKYQIFKENSSYRMTAPVNKMRDDKFHLENDCFLFLQMSKKPCI
jgi:hypothetical protein